MLLELIVWCSGVDVGVAVPGLLVLAAETVGAGLVFGLNIVLVCLSFFVVLCWCLESILSVRGIVSVFFG